MRDADAERLLLALADHLHEHCECPRPRSGGAICGACDLRGQLQRVRDELLAWRAEGRRLALVRDDALANGAEHVRRLVERCEECAALGALATTVRPQRPQR